MKVALLLSGQPRFVDSISYQTIKAKILDVYKPDVYCHVWFSSGATYETAPWSGLGKMSINDNSLELIKKLYNPVKILDEPPPSEDIIQARYVNTSHPRTPYNLSSMYLSMKKSYLLMNDQNYDFIIRLRYDAILTAFPDLNKLQKGVLYAPDYSQYHNNVGNNGLIMSPNIAAKIMTIYDRMNLIYNDGCILNDEQMITHLILKEKISTYILPKNIFYIELYRGN